MSVIKSIRALSLTAIVWLQTFASAHAIVLINFDDLVAPPVFSDQTALAEEYMSLGVHFSGTGEVINSVGNFGVSLAPPFSAPNFLAFNGDLGAFPPESVSFDFLVSFVSLDFAGSTGTISLTGFLGTNLIHSISVTSTSTSQWTPIALQGSVYDRIVFDVGGNTDGTFVVDNLRFEPVQAAVPEPSSMVIWCIAACAALLRRQTFSYPNGSAELVELET